MDRTVQILEMRRQGHSQSRIAEALKMCHKTVKRILESNSENAADPNVATPLAPLSDPFVPKWLEELDMENLIKEVQKGVPFQILYNEQIGISVKYWTFWKTLSKLANDRIEPVTTMRLRHNPGEKVFVDYTDGLDIHTLETGEIVSTQLFVGTLPFSSRVYAEFTFNQRMANFIASHDRMWSYFGGVTPYTVTDNLKQSVIRADLYDPDKNKTFTAYANHAGFAVLPARPNRPKDKANVECHAGLLQRSFYQEVRNHKFTSITELNEALWDFLERFNNQTMKDHGVSRNERFEVEKTCLQPLPVDKFEIPEVKEATVHPDCHIQFGRSFYSVPFRYVGQRVRVIGTFSKISIYDLNTLEKIASHIPARKNGERRTDELHWPPAKKEHCDFTAERAKLDGEKIGPKTKLMFEKLFEMRHPLQYLRRVQGWIRNVSQGKVSRESMEYASQMAQQHNNFSSSYVNSCAEFHENGGLLRVVPSAAPKREPAFSYIQK
jgi:transposase